MKSYTDLEQSKKLAEILPLESADMCYPKDAFGYDYAKEPVCHYRGIGLTYPCWSLTALLSVLPFHLIVNNRRYAFSMHKGLNKYGETYMFRYNVFNTDVCLYSTDYYNNPVDACVELILKLNELWKEKRQ
jgi:hypothetical protein